VRSERQPWSPNRRPLVTANFGEFLFYARWINPAAPHPDRPGPQKIKSMRESKGMTTRGLAKEAGISTETLFAIEHGRRQPTVTTLDKIARPRRRG
jgi:DNA-binding XRE family transcriptional regulator